MQPREHQRYNIRDGLTLPQEGEPRITTKGERRRAKAPPPLFFKEQTQ